VRGDAAALNQIFSDDVIVIVPGMRVMTKADAVGAASRRTVARGSPLPARQRDSDFWPGRVREPV
jgi:hypothetical protein